MKPRVIKNYTGKPIKLLSSIDHSFLKLFPPNGENKVVFFADDFEIPPYSTILQQIGPYIIKETDAIFLWPLLLKGVLLSDKCEASIQIKGLPEPQENVYYLVEQSVAFLCQEKRKDLLFPYTPYPNEENAYLEFATYSN